MYVSNVCILKILLSACCFALGFHDQASELCHKCHYFQWNRESYAACWCTGGNVLGLVNTYVLDVDVFILLCWWASGTAGNFECLCAQSTDTVTWRKCRRFFTVNIFCVCLVWLALLLAFRTMLCCFFFSLRSIKLSLLMQKEMATYRHWSVSLWRDPDDVSHCQILSPDKTEWRLISATLCRRGRCFVADQLWLMTRIREEEEDWCTLWRRQDVMLTATGFADVESSVIRFLPCTAMHTARY